MCHNEIQTRYGTSSGSGVPGRRRGRGWLEDGVIYVSEERCILMVIGSLALKVFSACFDRISLIVWLAVALVWRARVFSLSRDFVIGIHDGLDLGGLFRLTISELLLPP